MSHPRLRLFPLRVMTMIAFRDALILINQHTYNDAVPDPISIVALAGLAEISGAVLFGRSPEAWIVGDHPAP